MVKPDRPEDFQIPGGDELAGPGTCSVAAFTVLGHSWVVYFFTDDDMHPESFDDTTLMRDAHEINRRVCSLLKSESEAMGGGYSDALSRRFAGLDD